MCRPQHQRPAVGPAARRAAWAPAETSEAAGDLVWEAPARGLHGKRGGLRVQLAKAVRALTHLAKRRSAGEIALLGAGSRALSLLFVLRGRAGRAVGRSSPIRVSLPRPLLAGHPVAEGVPGRLGQARTLSLQFGWCDLPEEVLLRNARAVVTHVAKVVDWQEAVCELRVRELEGPMLPVWEAQCRRRRTRAAPALAAAGATPMGPPSAPLAKRAKDVGGILEAA